MCVLDRVSESNSDAQYIVEQDYFNPDYSIKCA